MRGHEARARQPGVPVGRVVDGGLQRKVSVLARAQDAKPAETPKAAEAPKPAAGPALTAIAPSQPPLKIAGLALGFLLWQVGFMSIGGEWFGMWQSKDWNGVPSAFRFVMCLAVNPKPPRPDKS